MKPEILFEIDGKIIDLETIPDAFTKHTLRDFGEVLGKRLASLSCEKHKQPPKVVVSKTGQSGDLLVKTNPMCCTEFRQLVAKHI